MTYASQAPETPTTAATTLLLFSIDSLIFLIGAPATNENRKKKETLSHVFFVGRPSVHPLLAILNIEG